MALLIGSETTAPHNETGNAAQIAFWRFEAQHTGTIEELILKTGTIAPTATSLILGVYEESAEVPTEVLGQGTFGSKPGESAEIKVTGLSIKVVKGTFYWLAFLPIGGTIHYKLTEPGGTLKDKLSTKKAYTKLEKTTEFSFPGALGPIWFKGVGTESGAATAAGKTAVTLAATARATGVVATAGTTPVAIVTKAAAAQVQHAVGASALILADTATPATKTAASAQTSVTLAAKATPAAGVTARAQAAVQLAAKAAAANVIAAQANARISLAAKVSAATASAAQAIASIPVAARASAATASAARATASIRLAAKATAKAGGAVARKVFIAIFED